MIPASTPTATRSSRNPTKAQCPIHGSENVRLNSAPYDSMIVSSKIVKPQNVRKCATPGTVHFSSLRCPSTSAVSVLTSRPGCSRTAVTRSGAGCPVNASRFSHHSRRPAIASATTVSTSPTVIRTTTPASFFLSGPQARSRFSHIGSSASDRAIWSIQVAEYELGDASRLIAALAFYENVGGQLRPARDCLKAGERRMCPNFRIAWNRARETHLIEAVIHYRMGVADFQDAGPHGDQEGKRQIAVSDRLPERPVLRAVY